MQAEKACKFDFDSPLNRIPWGKPTKCNSFLQKKIPSWSVAYKKLHLKTQKLSQWNKKIKDFFKNTDLNVLIVMGGYNGLSIDDLVLDDVELIDFGEVRR